MDGDVSGRTFAHIWDDCSPGPRSILNHIIKSSTVSAIPQEKDRSVADNLEADIPDCLAMYKKHTQAALRSLHYMRRRMVARKGYADDTIDWRQSSFPALAMNTKHHIPITTRVRSIDVEAHLTSWVWFPRLRTRDSRYSPESVGSVFSATPIRWHSRSC